MLKAGGFKEGNIIFEVSTWDCEEINLADVGELYELEPGHEPAAWEHKLMDRVKTQGLQMLGVSSSYGGTCLILAQAIEFVSENTQ